MSLFETLVNGYKNIKNVTRLNICWFTYSFFVQTCEIGFKVTAWVLVLLFYRKQLRSRVHRETLQFGRGTHLTRTWIQYLQLFVFDDVMVINSINIWTSDARFICYYSGVQLCLAVVSEAVLWQVGHVKLLRWEVL